MQETRRLLEIDRLETRRFEISTRCLRNAKEMINDIRTNNFMSVKAVLDSAKYVARAEKTFIPYVCIPDAHQTVIWQSEHIFGPSYNMSLHNVTLDQNWPLENRDFMWSYRLFLYVLQHHSFAAINDTAAQKRFLNNKNDVKFTPVCYNPVKVIHYEEEFVKLQIPFVSATLQSFLQIHIDGMIEKQRTSFNDNFTESVFAADPDGIC